MREVVCAESSFCGATGGWFIRSPTSLSVSLYIHSSPPHVRHRLPRFNHTCILIYTLVHRACCSPPLRPCILAAAPYLVHMYHSRVKNWSKSPDGISMGPAIGPLGKHVCERSGTCTCQPGSGPRDIELTIWQELGLNVTIL